jgi:hypothetical protein
LEETPVERVPTRTYEIPIALLDVNIKGVGRRHREMATMPP